MAVTVTMPQLGETVTEGTILSWAKQVGDTIALDEVLVEISTDKVDTEMPSPTAGVIEQILVAEGETVEVGTEIAVIADGSEDAAAEPAATETDATDGCCDRGCCCDRRRGDRRRDGAGRRPEPDRWRSRLVAAGPDRHRATPSRAGRTARRQTR